MNIDDEKEQDEIWEPSENEEQLEEFVELLDNSEPEPESGSQPQPQPDEHDAVQKRIDAITRQRGEADRRAEAAESELGQLKSRMEQLESGVGQRSVAEFDEKYEDVKLRLHAATEEGDTTAQVDLMEKMTDMRSAKRLHEIAKRQKPQQPQQPATPEQGDAPQAAYDWWNRNTWFNTVENNAESAYARALDIKLEEEGLDKNSQEYYNELDKRLQKSFPHLYTNTEGAVKPSKPPTISSQGSGRQGKPPKDGRIRLTKEELNMAKEFGLETEEELRAYEAQIIKTGARD